MQDLDDYVQQELQEQLQQGIKVILNILLYVLYCYQLVLLSKLK